MNRINNIGVEPGIWQHIGTGENQVVTEIQTHEFVGGAVIVMDDPMVIYRDVIEANTHIRYGMKKSEFIVKFKKI